MLEVILFIILFLATLYAIGWITFYLALQIFHYSHNKFAKEQISITAEDKRWIANLWPLLVILVMAFIFAIITMPFVTLLPPEEDTETKDDLLDKPGYL